MSGAEPAAADAPRWCKVCGRTVEGSVCPRCALDLDTGELVGVPEPLDMRAGGPGGEGAVYEARAPRGALDWGAQLYRQLARALLGVLAAWLLLCMFYGLRLLSVIPTLVALGCVLVVRCSQTYTSPVLFPPGEQPGWLGGGEELPAAELPAEELPAAERPALRERPAPDPLPLGLVALLAGLEASAFTLVVGGPAAFALDGKAFNALKAAGLLPPLVTSEGLARASILGTLFLGGLAFALWARLVARAAPAYRPPPQHLHPGALPMGGLALLRGIAVAFLLALMLQFPALLVVGVLAFPLALAGISDPGGAWLPGDLWDAARARSLKTYLRSVAFSGPLLCLLVWTLSVPHDGGYGFLVLASLGTIAASLLGAAAGLDHYDAATRWRRVPKGVLAVAEGEPAPTAWPAANPEAALELGEDPPA
ncbi:MAG: hypothetical protein AB7N76_19665 [Planctomycetota bacterium]